jgi:hypothetical protein
MTAARSVLAMTTSQRSYRKCSGPGAGGPGACGTSSHHTSVTLSASTTERTQGACGVAAAAAARARGMGKPRAGAGTAARRGRAGRVARRRRRAPATPAAPAPGAVAAGAPSHHGLEQRAGAYKAEAREAEAPVATLAAARPWAAPGRVLRQLVIIDLRRGRECVGAGCKRPPVTSPRSPFSPAAAHREADVPLVGPHRAPARARARPARSHWPLLWCRSGRGVGLCATRRCGAHPGAAAVAAGAAPGAARGRRQQQRQTSLPGQAARGQRPPSQSPGAALLPLDCSRRAPGRQPGACLPAWPRVQRARRLSARAPATAGGRRCGRGRARGPAVPRVVRRRHDPRGWQAGCAWAPRAAAAPRRCPRAQGCGWAGPSCGAGLGPRLRGCGLPIVEPGRPGTREGCCWAPLGPASGPAARLEGSSSCCSHCITPLAGPRPRHPAFFCFDRPLAPPPWFWPPRGPRTADSARTVAIKVSHPAPTPRGARESVSPCCNPPRGAAGRGHRGGPRAIWVLADAREIILGSAAPAAMVVASKHQPNWLEARLDKLFACRLPQQVAVLLYKNGARAERSWGVGGGWAPFPPSGGGAARGRGRPCAPPRRRRRQSRAAAPRRRPHGAWQN